MWNRRLKGIEAVVVRQQCMLAKRDDVRLVRSADRDGVRLFAGAKLGRIEGYRRDAKPRGRRLSSRPFPATDHHDFRPRVAHKTGHVTSLGKRARPYHAKSQFAATAHGKTVVR